MSLSKSSPSSECAPDRGHSEVSWAAPPEPRFQTQFGVPVIIPIGYSNVVITGLMSALQISYQWSMIGIARHDFSIPVPFNHSPEYPIFNVIYRAYQSTMEVYPQFLFCHLVGGLEMPYFCTLGAVIWMLGRYYRGRSYYETGELPGKPAGSYYRIGLIMVYIAATRFAVKRMFS